MASNWFDTFKIKVFSFCIDLSLKVTYKRGLLKKS